jgi:ribA/ribD-fused uncharacterized protein
MNKEIAGFFLTGWYVFDNFAPFQVVWRGKLYPTSEHAYQAAHFIDVDPNLAEQVRQIRSPRAAADFANSNSAHDDPEWANKKVSVMEEIVKCKLEQHDYIREVLILSGSLDIVEMNDSDEFWGWGKNQTGRNELGKIWMRLRDEL